MQLVFSALPRFSGHFKTLPPCIWKPARLWSGKQVVSTLLLNIIPEDQDRLNLLSKAKIVDKVCVCAHMLCVCVCVCVCAFVWMIAFCNVLLLGVGSKCSERGQQRKREEEKEKEKSELF